VPLALTAGGWEYTIAQSQVVPTVAQVVVAPGGPK